MSTSNTPSLLPDQQEFNMFQVIARTAQSSGLYAGVGGEAKIFMILLAARELGISPMLALNGGIWNIQGRIEISARLMSGLVRRAGHSIKVIRNDDTACILLGKRTDGDSFECSFTIQDAEKAGLSARDVWKKYAKDMLYNRCMSRLSRILFSDVIGTAYVEGEISEAKAVEKLQQAECEDITPTACPPSEERDITPEQVDELDGLSKQCDAECLKNIMGYMKDKWDISMICDLPKEHFNTIRDGMLRNIESKQSKAVQNGNS
jgi:hypothetical protein